MTTPIQRDETRRQRYNKKLKTAQYIPVSLAVINLQKSGNVSYFFRSAFCFGSKHIHIIGNLPNRDTLNDLSGSTFDYVPHTIYSRPEDFIAHCRKNNIKMVALELPTANFPATQLEEYKFDFSRENVIICGSETTGVPSEILQHSERIYVDHRGGGFCLNTSQVGNICLYEASKQYWKDRL